MTISNDSRDRIKHLFEPVALAMGRAAQAALLDRPRHQRRRAAPELSSVTALTLLSIEQRTRAELS